MGHEECPMAVALKEQREVRGVEAMAERPDGTIVQFMPYPTPLYDASVILVGALNMLIDISDRKRADMHAQWLASIVQALRAISRRCVWSNCGACLSRLAPVPPAAV